MQKNGAGLHTASSCYWDNTSDGMNGKHDYKVTYCYFTYRKSLLQVGKQDDVLYLQCIWVYDMISMTLLFWFKV